MGKCGDFRKCKDEPKSINKCSSSCGSRGSVGPQGPVGPVGPAGASGSSVLNGSGPPEDSFGSMGDFYIDTNTETMYGPKRPLSNWDGSGVSLIGAQGPQGPEGPVSRDYGVLSEIGGIPIHEKDDILYIKKSDFNGTSIEPVSEGFLYKGFKLTEPGTYLAAFDLSDQIAVANSHEKLGKVMLSDLYRSFTRFNIADPNGITHFSNFSIFRINEEDKGRIVTLKWLSNTLLGQRVLTEIVTDSDPVSSLTAIIPQPLIPPSTYTLVVTFNDTINNPPSYDGEIVHAEGLYSIKTFTDTDIHITATWATESDKYALYMFKFNPIEEGDDFIRKIATLDTRRGLNISNPIHLENNSFIEGSRTILIIDIKHEDGIVVEPLAKLNDIVIEYSEDSVLSTSSHYAYVIDNVDDESKELDVTFIGNGGAIYSYAVIEARISRSFGYNGNFSMVKLQR